MPEVAVNQDNVVYTVKQMSPYIAFVVAAFVALVVGYASYFHTEEEPLWVSGYCMRSLLLHEPSKGSSALLDSLVGTHNAVEYPSYFPALSTHLILHTSPLPPLHLFHSTPPACECHAPCFEVGVCWPRVQRCAVIGAVARTAGRILLVHVNRKLVAPVHSLSVNYWVCILHARRTVGGTLGTY